MRPFTITVNTPKTMEAYNELEKACNAMKLPMNRDDHNAAIRNIRIAYNRYIREYLAVNCRHVDQTIMNMINMLNETILLSHGSNDTLLLSRMIDSLTSRLCNITAVRTVRRRINFKKMIPAA